MSDAIGSIIIGSIGYGAALLFAACCIRALYQLGNTEDPAEEARLARIVIGAFLVALVLGVVTRWLT